MTFQELDDAVKGKLVADHAVSLDESELQRILGNVVLPEKCLASARRMIADGLTLNSLYAEFNRNPGDWNNDDGCDSGSDL